MYQSDQINPFFILPFTMIKYQILMSYIVMIFFYLEINNGNNGGFRVICNQSVKERLRSRRKV